MLLDCGTELMHDFIRRSLWLHLIARHMGHWYEELSKVVTMHGTYATQSVLCKASTGRSREGSCCDYHNMPTYIMLRTVDTVPASWSGLIFALSSHGHDLLTTAL